MLSFYRHQYLQHIRSMYNPDYKLGLQRTLEAERQRNNTLKRTIAVMQSEVTQLNNDGEGNSVNKSIRCI